MFVLRKEQLHGVIWFWLLLLSVQVIITVLLISVQVIGATIWLLLEPPGVRPYHPFGRKDEVSTTSFLCVFEVRRRYHLIFIIYEAYDLHLLSYTMYNLCTCEFLNVISHLSCRTALYCTHADEQEWSWRGCCEVETAWRYTVIIHVYYLLCGTAQTVQ